MYIIKQTNNKDCGFTCLKMILASLNKDKNYLFIPNYQLDKAYSYNDLIKVANDYRLTLCGYKVTDKKEIINNNRYPLIATLLIEEEKHAVIVTKANNKYVYLIDPSIGKVKMSLEQFVTLWDSNVLLIEKHEKHPCPHKPLEVISTKRKIMMSFLQLLSGISFILASYFISEGTYFFVPIILVSVYALLEIGLRYSMMKTLKQIDDNLLSSQIQIVRSNRSFYTSFLDVKKYSMLFPMNLIYHLLLAGFIIVLLLINNLYNMFLFIPVIGLALFKVVIINPSLDKKTARINQLENEVDYAKKDLAKFKIKEAQDVSYKYYLISSLYSIVSLLIVILSCVLVMTLQGVVSLTFILCYSCLTYFLTKSLTSLFNYEEDKQTYYSALASLSSSYKINQ